MALDFTKLYNGQSVQEACEGMNTNLELINQAITKLSESGAVPTIYNSVWIEDLTDLVDGTVQVSISDNLIKIGQVNKGTWVIICEVNLSTGGSGEIELDTDSNYIAYPLSNVDETLEGKPFGYAFGKLALAGSKVTNEETGEKILVHAVGWYINGKKVVFGRLSLSEVKTAGAVVYVLNGGGWTTETPEQTEGYLIQPIGSVSDDGNYIDISICEGWGTV